MWTTTRALQNAVLGDNILVKVWPWYECALIWFWCVLNTIFLNEITGQETDELFEADQNCNYPLVRYYSGGSKLSKSRIEQVLRVEKNRLDHGDAFQLLLIREKNTNQLLGMLNVSRGALEPDEASIGVCVIKSALNQDVATKACRLVIARIFEDEPISHITAEMHIADEIASRVSEKIPMNLEQAQHAAQSRRAWNFISKNTGRGAC